MTRTQRYLTFAAAILVTGVLSGIAGGFTTLLVKAIEHLTYGYAQGPLLTGVRDASIERRMLGPAIGCALARCRVVAAPAQGDDPKPHRADSRWPSIRTRSHGN